MNQNDPMEDMDFSNIFEGLTDKLGAEAAPFLSPEEEEIQREVKRKLYMRLLTLYENVLFNYLEGKGKVDYYGVIELQEILNKHKSI
jgi:hypothetical protein